MLMAEYTMVTGPATCGEAKYVFPSLLTTANLTSLTQGKLVSPVSSSDGPSEGTVSVEVYEVSNCLCLGLRCFEYVVSLFELQGEWKIGLRHGIGEQTFRDGSTYSGTWENDLPHQHGTYKFANGDVYSGGPEPHPSLSFPSIPSFLSSSLIITFSQNGPWAEDTEPENSRRLKMAAFTMANGTMTSRMVLALC